MAKDQGVKTPARGPAGKVVRAPAGKAPAVSPAAAKAVPAEPPKKKTSPQQFWREVQTEARKITWTPWRETWITSVMVGIMVVITAIFFSVVDGSLNFLMQQFLRLASGG
jgi:preprotein translocase subunit SecE